MAFLAEGSQGGIRDQPLTVTALTQAIRDIVEGSFGQVSVEGEVFSARKASSGHLYFTLKDRGAELPCVMWRSSVARLGLEVRSGMKVVLSGSLNVYVPHGRYQMVARTLRESGLGELLARLEALRQRLAAEGLFEEARKRPLPFLPRRVGVVTAVTGAAIRDIIETIQNRYPTQILIYPTAVQGPGSAERIARGIARLDAVPDVDVIIVGRGGGSLQDLWAFNEEVVVRAIARCETPVISAVGHEVDTLLSDAAADVRAATPTAAGELAVPNMADLRYTLQGHTDRMQRATRFRVSEGRVALAGTLRRMGDPRRLVGERQQLVDELLFRGQMGMQKRLAKAREGRAILQARLKNLHPRNRIQASRGELTHLEMRLETAARRLMASLRTSLHGHEAALEHLSPIASLERGYAIVRSTKGGVLTDAGKVQQGDELQILLHRGAIGARVVDTDSKNDFEPESP